MYSIKLLFVKAMKNTKTCNVILYKDVITNTHVLGKYFRKSASFYPCDSEGKELNTNRVGEMFL